MEVREWIGKFLDEHRARFNPHDWPEPGTEEYTSEMLDWIDAFQGPGVTFDEAVRASRRLRLKPPNWKREHLPAVVETIARMRAERQAPADTVNSMDSARAASLDCRACGGTGMVVLWHPRPDPGRKVAATAGAHCTCTAGRFMRKRIANEDVQLLRRIPDYADVLDGRSGWLDADPTVVAVEGGFETLKGRQPPPQVDRRRFAAIGQPVPPDRILTPVSEAVAGAMTDESEPTHSTKEIS